MAFLPLHGSKESVSPAGGRTTKGLVVAEGVTDAAPVRGRDELEHRAVHTGVAAIDEVVGDC